MTTQPWKATVFTLYPGIFPGTLGASIIGKALAEKKWALDVINIRDFAEDKHQTVDDIAFGGGPGMVMRPDVLGKALEHTFSSVKPDRLIYLSPRGKTLTQEKVTSLAVHTSHIGVICGRFEGIDERVLDAWDVEEVSIGDYVLAGGEVAAQVLLEATVRLLPGVVGAEASLNEESFTQGLLEYPHYTRPREWQGRGVPDVLASGHHGHIKAWRQAQAEALTKVRRPDLWEKYTGGSPLN